MMSLLKKLYWVIDDNVRHFLWKYGEDLFWAIILIAAMLIISGGER